MGSRRIAGQLRIPEDSFRDVGNRNIHGGVKAFEKRKPHPSDSKAVSKRAKKPDKPKKNKVRLQSFLDAEKFKSIGFDRIQETLQSLGLFNIKVGGKSKKKRGSVKSIFESNEPKTRSPGIRKVQEFSVAKQRFRKFDKY